MLQYAVCDTADRHLIDRAVAMRSDHDIMGIQLVGMLKNLLNRRPCHKQTLGFDGLLLASFNKCLDSAVLFVVLVRSGFTNTLRPHFISDEVWVGHCNMYQYELSVAGFRK